MRILLIGATGQLGGEITRSRLPAGTVLIAAARSRLDLARPETIAAHIEESRPDLIINAAGYTAVDRAEVEEHLAFTVNATGAGTLAEAAARADIPIVHFSTDYVFDGRKAGAWSETDKPNPVNAYGRSKYAGEIAVAEANPRHLIFRISWLYAARGQNFLNTMLRLGRERQHLTVVDDQIGRPSAAADLAGTVLTIARIAIESDDRWGIYHLSNGGEPISWYDFAREIFQRREAGVNVPPRLEPISTEAYNAPAPRPLNSVMDLSKIEAAFGLKPRSWQAALDDVMREKQSDMLGMRTV